MTQSMTALTGEARTALDAVDELWKGKVTRKSGETTDQALDRLRQEMVAHLELARAQVGIALQMVTGG